MDSGFDVLVLRMVTGEDVISKVFSEDDDVLLHNPLRMIRANTEYGSKLILIQWLPVEFITDDVSIIKNDSILTIMRPNEKLLNYYIKTLKALSDHTIKSQMLQDYSSGIDSFDARSTIQPPSQMIH